MFPSFPHKQGSSFNPWSHRPLGCLNWLGGQSTSLSTASGEVLGLLLVRLLDLGRSCLQTKLPSGKSFSKALGNLFSSSCSCLLTLGPLPSPVGNEGIDPWSDQVKGQTQAEWPTRFGQPWWKAAGLGNPWEGEGWDGMREGESPWPWPETSPWRS